MSSTISRVSSMFQHYRFFSNAPSYVASRLRHLEQLLLTGGLKILSMIMLGGRKFGFSTLSCSDSFNEDYALVR